MRRQVSISKIPVSKVLVFDSAKPSQACTETVSRVEVEPLMWLKIV